MRTEHAAQLPVPPLTQEVQVEVTERRQEAVRVVVRDVGARRAQPVARGRVVVGERELEETARIDLGHLVVLTVDDDARRSGSRPVHAHHDATARTRMDAEERVRVVVRAGDEPVEVAFDRGREGPGHPASRSRSVAMLRTGMSTQSGRWSSS